MSNCYSSTYRSNQYTRQCIFSVYGGKVEVTGEILHGKTSPLSHDNRGVYAGLEQGLPVTRYHSLAGTHATLPVTLEVSSWIDRGPDQDKIIMGVRHKELLVEGVQFHPESILTAEGRTMVRNFLRMQGGTWKENAALISAKQPKTKSSNTKDANLERETILEKIYRHRRVAVQKQKQIPSLRPADLQEYFELGLAPPQISFPERLRASPFPISLLAEIKRASPSKGPIAMDICAPAQARRYAKAGASVISVLTEPEWFHGSIDDLRAVRQSLTCMPNRPAVLRKEFVFDEYQILEARLGGADTVLLIVKMLDVPLLQRLYEYSLSLGMEPLVEVNNVEEMKIAVELGSKVIGVNNRNLASFEVDLDTTSRLMKNVPKDTIICALSGISGPADVKTYKESGVGGVLVGEALMRADDVGAFVSNLLGATHALENGVTRCPPLVKICGTRTPEAAHAAIEAGADFIGIILVEGRSRYVSKETALAISRVVHETRSRSAVFQAPTLGQEYSSRAGDYFTFNSQVLQSKKRAFLVGVFQNQPLTHILHQITALELDVVQLHGSEPVEWASLIPVPVLHRFGPHDPALGSRGYHTLPLIDSAVGGTGKKVDMAAVVQTLEADPGLHVALAGGLNPGNVKDVMQELGEVCSRVAILDVSSGVESAGSQDLEKIRGFVAAVKSL